MTNEIGNLVLLTIVKSDYKPQTKQKLPQKQKHLKIHNISTFTFNFIEGVRGVGLFL